MFSKNKFSIRNISKTIIGIIVILFASQIFAQSTFLVDFLNLKSTNESFFKSYDIVKLEDAWNSINEKQPPLSLVKIGVVDSGVDILNPEFSNVNIGNTPNDAKTDSKLADLPGEIFGHGTQVTGIIGANNISETSGDNYLYPQMNGILSGVNRLPYVMEIRKVNLHSLKLAWSAASKVNELAKEKVDIINFSWSTSRADVSGIKLILEMFFPALFNLRDTLFVVSAGQHNIYAELEFPGSLGDNLDNVITVGATTNGATFDPVDKRWGAPGTIFGEASNFGGAVNISAPGEFVYAPAPVGKGDFPTTGMSTKNYDTMFNGTSASAPLVTGVAGILKSIKPSLTPAQIKQILIRTSDIITTDKPIGGRLNAYRAVCDPDVLNCAASVMWDSGESPFGFALGWDNYSFPLVVTTSGTPSSLQFFLDDVTVPVSGYFTVEGNGITYATSSIFTTGVFDEHGVWANAHKFTIHFTESTNIPVGTLALVVGHFGGGQWSGLWGGLRSFIGTLYGTDVIPTPTLSTPAQFQLSNMGPVTTATPMGGVISPP